MPEIDDATFRNLQDIVHEIAFLANRMEEWMEFEKALRVLQRWFERTFVREVKINSQNFNAQTFVDLLRMWETSTEWLDLTIFVEGVRHINRPSWRTDAAGAPAPANPMRVVDLTDLNGVREAIGQAIADQAMARIEELCNRLITSLTRQLVDHQRVVRNEINVLSGLTSRLQSAF